MSTDQLLSTVLGAFQKVHDPDQCKRILSTTASLLAQLANPLNITLLTSHLLIAPAIWAQPDDLRTCHSIISIFNTAAITVRQRELDGLQHTQARQAGGLGCDEWARAVIKGADDKSPRWRHLLVIGGVLLGMEAHERQAISRGLRSTLEGAVVTATNLALEDPGRSGKLGLEAVVLVLTHTFELLSDRIRRGLDYDALPPILSHAMVSTAGYQDGYFLATADHDVKQTTEGKFGWSPRSPSFSQLQEVASKPLVSSMSRLSMLFALTIENMKTSTQASLILDDLVGFSGFVAKNWRENKLSELDPSEETTYLTTETTSITFPLLWQVLKSMMFATIVVLRAIIGRTLVDPILTAGISAPRMASRTLHVLRNIHFISSRMGSNTFSAYNFVFLASVDILSQFPTQSKQFLTEIQPVQLGQLPSHPLDRNLDLYFLNTCEHFTLILSPEDNESLIVTAASPYLNPTAHKNLLEIFEAAHSAMLLVLAAPQNAKLTIKLIPFYAEALFSSFPTNLSPRQFQIAFKTLLHITTPPAPLSASQPLLPDTLLELLYHRAQHAPTTPLPPALVFKSKSDGVADDKQPQLSEQAVLILSLLDALPSLPILSLEEWLPLAAELLNMIEDDRMREICKRRFWDVLESGEMDVDRAAVGVAWWTTRGGREMVLSGRVQHFGLPYMSGGLPPPDGSRL